MKLRPYQEKIAQKIDERFQGREREARHFVGVKLPTGGGKSFLFLDQFDKLIDEHNQEEQAPNPLEDSNSCISTARVKYYAPLKGILEQTQVRVAEFILIDRYISLFQQKYGLEVIDEQNLSKAVDEITNRMVNVSKINGKQKRQEAFNRIQEIYSQKLKEGKRPEDILKEVLEDSLEVLVDNIDKLVTTEFPNMEFVCYQKNKSDVIEVDAERLAEEGIELIVFDEAHRNKMQNDKEDGQKTWGEIAKELIKRLGKTRFLAITATPERDADGEDPMLEFADIARYNETELRKQDYLASDMALVSALEEGLVVKPDIVTFDCMLDRTKEYQEIEEKVLKAIQSPKKGINLVKKVNKETGKLEITDDYHRLLINFIKMNQLSGKLEFLRTHLQNPEMVSVIEKFNDRSYVDEGTQYFDKLEKLIASIAQIDRIIQKIDNNEMVEEQEDSEIYHLAQDYHQWQETQMEQIVSDVQAKRTYLQHGKYICFTPTSPSKEKTLGLMYRHKEKMQTLLGVEAEDVLITHSNKDVVPSAEDKRNLAKFTLKRDEHKPPLVMVAMNKFNEGLHVSGVVSSFMFRQFTEGSTTQEDKEEPRIIFLQQVGRCIHSIEPGEVVTEPPVIFDVACNFMRYNEKLNELFQISPSQMEFKKLYDESRELSKNKNRVGTQEVVEEDVPKPKILDRILGIMQALSENGIDITGITNETTWEELETQIPEEKREEVLDGIFVMTRKRMRPDYPIGSRIASARAAFWHTERENPQTKSTKKLYNSRTDEFFTGKTFEELYGLGFFKDLEMARDSSKINVDGFLIGECAAPENYHGFNIKTGTRYTKGIPQYGIPGVDIKGFSQSGIHIRTGIRYDEHFFRFDRKTGQWKNLLTGKDEDMLGYNHDGIRVNSEKGRIGFDRNGLWHRKIGEGEYSPEGSLYDDSGRDVFGFGSDNKAPDGTQYINGFYRVKRRDGSLSYFFRDGGSVDLDGYDIDGFNAQGFNREGIHRETGCRYNPSGVTIDAQGKRVAFPLKRILEGTFLSNEPNENKRNRIIQAYLTQWIALNTTFKDAIENSEWYRRLILDSYEKATGKKAREEVRNMSNEMRASQKILAENNIQELQGLDQELQRQNEEKQKLLQEKSAKKAEVSRLAAILQQIIQKREDEGGQEL